MIRSRATASRSLILLFILGLIIAVMALSKSLLPWVLEEKAAKGNPYRWVVVERLPSREICRERGRRRMEKTGRPWRCRFDG